MNDSFSSIEVRVYIWSYSSKVFWFLIFHVFSFMCSHFCESSAYLVVINIFYYKFIEVFMRGDFRKHLSFCTFLDSLPHSFFANTKKRDVTSHPIMTCNGAIIWDTSFEQRSFALKLFILRLIASSPLIVDTAYAHITTSVFFWISQYWSCLIIFPDPEIQEHHDCPDSYFFHDKRIFYIFVCISMRNVISGKPADGFCSEGYGKNCWILLC